MSTVFWPGYPGYTAGAALPRALVMVGADSDYHLTALLTARELGENGGLPLGEIRVISNVPNTDTCEAIARAANVDYFHRPAGPRRYAGNGPESGVAPERRQHMQWVAAQWTEFNPDLVILAKYMIILEPEILDLKPWRVINIHHGILPAFQGRSALASAVQAGTDITGATCHFATRVLDQGPLIHQVAFPIDRTEPQYAAGVRDVVTRNIPLMKEAETVALLEGLGYYLRGRLELVENLDLGKHPIPDEVRKDFRLRKSGPHGVDISRFGRFPLLRSAWATYRESLGIPF